MADEEESSDDGEEGNITRSYKESHVFHHSDTKGPSLYQQYRPSNRASFIILIVLLTVGLRWMGAGKIQRFWEALFNGSASSVSQSVAGGTAPKDNTGSGSTGNEKAGSGSSSGSGEKPACGPGTPYPCQGTTG